MVRVVFNPAAGPAMTRHIGAVRQHLASRGIPFEIAETAGPGDATLLAREAAHSGAETVVAVGGDGTINEVANGLAGSGTRLLAVPHGTGNVFAQELGLPGSPGECLDLLTTGRTISVPLARAGARHFVLMASAGFDAEIVERMGSRGKRALGRSAYVLAGIRHILRPQPTLWLELPGKERIEAQLALLCRGKRYAGRAMAPGGDLEGKSLRLVILSRRGRWAIAKFALDVLRGRHLDSPAVQCREIDSVVVRSKIPSAVQVDGEYLGPLPVRFEMTGVALRVVVPDRRPERPIG